MAKVELRKVEKIYDNGFKAVHGIDLEIKDGEFMVLVGPSGCAKSTTLRMIAGLEEISGGEVIIGDTVVNDVHAKDRGIAMVFQNYALYPHMSVYENMAFALKIRKLPKDEIDKKVREAAEILDLQELLDRRPKELSGGQRQRVAVGRAIVRNPEVFLFDEPLSNLDAKLRVHMRVQISQLHQKLKSTMIYVTHDQTEAMTMGDRICVMNFGKIMQVDTPLNLYNYPKNKFVAGFIGSPAMNMLDGELIKSGDKIAVKVGSNEFVLSKDKAEKVKGHVGKKVCLGVRPEYINLEAGETTSAIKGTVDVLEHMGSESFVYFNLGDVQIVSKIDSSASKNLNSGSTVDFMFHMENSHIFDVETEQNISI